MRNTDIFFSCKNRKFHQKNFGIFDIFAQNIDCGYTFEPPRRGGSNEYLQSMLWNSNKKIMFTPLLPHFYNIKVGYKGVYMKRTCCRDEQRLPYRTPIKTAHSNAVLGKDAESRPLSLIDLVWWQYLKHFFDVMTSILNGLKLDEENMHAYFLTRLCLITMLPSMGPATYSVMALIGVQYGSCCYYVYHYENFPMRNTAVKIENFIRNILIFLIFCSKH